MRPEVRRKITVQDLPPPGSNALAINRPHVRNRPPDARPKVPPGFNVELYASGFRDPRFLLAAPNGDIFVVESRANQIKALHDANGDGKRDVTETFAERGLKKPFGIAFYPPGDDPQHFAAGGNLNYPVLVSKYDSSMQYGESWILFMYPSGQLAFVVYEGASGDSYRYLLTDSPVLSPDVWKHVAATFDGTTQLMQIYVDGVAVPSSLVAGSVVITSITDSNTPVRIGAAVNVFGQVTSFWRG